VKVSASRGARILVLGVLVATLAGCALPRGGPNKRELFAGSVQRQGDAFIVTVSDSVVRATAVTPALGFTEEFQRAGQLGPDTIRPGDVLGFSIYENVEDGLLGSTVTGAAVLTEIQVDGSGNIFVPYAGRLQASGKTPDQLRQLITEKLDVQTPDPQVVVRRVAGDGATVSVTGTVTGQGIYPIERSTRMLSGMLAKAGGITVPEEVAQVRVIRGERQGTIWMTDLNEDPEVDIALRGGDRVIVSEDRRAYTAMGATGTQTRVQFRTQNLSALEAIAQVGGLNGQVADPTGVFVLRDELEPVANNVLGRDDLVGLQRMVYVLDLTQPNGVFLARDFLIRDGDTVYVTEAPYTQFTKVLQAFTGPLGTVNAATQLTTTFAP